MRVSFIATTIALTAAVSLLVQAAYKPVEPEEQSGAFVDGKPAPDTIAGLKADADAVVLVTYSGYHRTLTCHRPCIISSRYAFEIRQILKPHPELASNRQRFELDLLGGIEESATSVTRVFVNGRRDPIRGRRYVIFASRLGNTWIPATGNAGGKDSIYDVSDERPITMSTEDWDNNFPPSSLAFLAELRRD